MKLKRAMRAVWTLGFIAGSYVGYIVGVFHAHYTAANNDDA